MKNHTALLVLSLACLSGAGFAQSAKTESEDRLGWHKIAETTVDLKQERDEVGIAGAHKFSAIKFRIQDEPIDLVEAYVVYGSGADQKITVNAHIKAAGDSKEFNLVGSDRTVKKIGFVYKTLPNVTNKKAHVEIWGYKKNTEPN